MRQEKNVQKKTAACDQEEGKNSGNGTGWEARFKSLKMKRFIYFILSCFFFLKSHFLKEIQFETNHVPTSKAPALVFFQLSFLFCFQRRKETSATAYALHARYNSGLESHLYH